ncbi:MAG: FAD-dependent oxidoreductase [Anaerovoracaceae bacterium]
MSKVLKADYTTESVAGFTHRTALEEAARCLLCYDAPCSEGCPAGTDPGKFIRSIKFRNDKGAAETIRENNVMGGSCARVCPYDRLCEEACSRCGIDKPIQIGKLQRYALEQEKAYGMKILQAPDEKKAGKIACVGAGPSSMACAAELAKAGYDVTIYDRNEKPGGVLTYGIVPSRLPQEVVDQDVQSVRDLGVKFEMGREVKAADLDGFDAVYIGAGLWAPKLPPIEGTGLEGAIPANVYLKQARTAGDAFKETGKVIVIGGGDVAVDCAVTAKLGGADDVRIVYRRTLEEAPGNMVEFMYALSLGIGITTNMAPEKLEGNGKVESMCFTGRKGVTEGSSLKLEADKVVFAIGQGAEDMKAIADIDVNEKGGIIAGEDGVTSGEKFFAGGDIVNGGQTVVEAVAEGKSAAESIIAYLDKKGVK